jgi:hypothetical protein
MTTEGSNTQFDFSRLSIADLDAIHRHCNHYCEVPFAFSDDASNYEEHQGASEFYEQVGDAALVEIDTRIKLKFDFEGFIKKTKAAESDEKYIDYMASKL